MARRARRTHSPAFKANQISAWKAQVLDGAPGLFGGGGAAETAPAVDVKVQHAKIGELTLENDLRSSRGQAFGRCARQSWPAERKAMIERGQRSSAGAAG